MNRESEHSQPPQPPEIDRRLRLHPTQAIGALLLLLLPALALFGIFGESRQTMTVSDVQLEMRVEHPTRLRYRMTDSIRVSLTNLSAAPLPAVTVSFDRSYLDRFSRLAFHPAVKSITGAAYVVEIADLQPREMRVISVEIQADDYWRQRGKITATSAGAGSGVEAGIETLVFP